MQYMYLSQVEMCVCEEVRVVGGDKPHHWLIALGPLVHTDGKVWLLHDQVQPLSLWRLHITMVYTIKRQIYVPDLFMRINASQV